MMNRMLPEPQILRLSECSSRLGLRAELLRLIEENFPEGSPLEKPLALEDEFFFLLDSANSARNIFIQDESGKPVSSVSWRPFEVQMPDENSKAPKKILKVAALGLVVTDEKHRGLGYSKRLIEAAEEAARQEGCLLSFLWSDLLEFYAKKDYLPLGSELSWILPEDERKLREKKLRTEYTANGVELTPAQLGDLPACLKLYGELNIGPTRSPQAFERFLQLPDSKLLLVRKEKTLLGYGLIGKARDLRNTLHEVVGDKEIVAPLVLGLLEATPARQPVRVQYPPEGPLTEELFYWLGDAKPEAFSLIKVLQPSELLNWIQKNVPLPGLTLKNHGERGFQILDRKRKEIFKSPDPAHLTQLFMSPFHPSEFGILPDECLSDLENFRPLNPYFWGLDSV
jgi:GNAT superfamily N-acetyltransferase